MKKFLFVLLLAVSSLAQAWDQRPPMPVAQCQAHSPYGFAQTARTAQPICREAYLVAYDAPVKIPVYVAYTLLPQNALGCFPRTNAFVADQSVPNGARPDDYAGTGYDKGHAAPDGDLSWSQQVEYESFLMTNMYPQHGSLNRGIWKLLETSVRGWAVQLNQSYTVYAGAIYGAGDPTIGNGVIVPHGYYKIVINNQNGETLAFLFPHTANLPDDIAGVQSTVAEIEQYTSVVFPVPDNKTMRRPIWNSNGRALLAARQAQCRR